MDVGARDGLCGAARLNARTGRQAHIALGLQLQIAAGQFDAAANLQGSARQQQCAAHRCSAQSGQRGGWVDRADGQVAVGAQRAAGQGGCLYACGLHGGIAGHVQLTAAAGAQHTTRGQGDQGGAGHGHIARTEGQHAGRAVLAHGTQCEVAASGRGGRCRAAAAVQQRELAGADAGVGWRVEQRAVDRELPEAGRAQHGARAEVDLRVAAQQHVAGCGERTRQVALDAQRTGVAARLPRYLDTAGAQRQGARVADEHAVAELVGVAGIQGQAAAGGVETGTAAHDQIAGPGLIGWHAAAAQHAGINIAAQPHYRGVAFDAQGAGAGRLAAGRTGLQRRAVFQRDAGPAGQHQVSRLQCGLPARHSDLLRAHVQRAAGAAGHCAQHQRLRAKRVQRVGAEHQRTGHRVVADHDLACCHVGQAAARGRVFESEAHASGQRGAAGGHHQRAGIGGQARHGVAVAQRVAADRGGGRGLANFRRAARHGRRRQPPAAGGGGHRRAAQRARGGTHHHRAVLAWQRDAQRQRAAGLGPHQEGAVEQCISRRQQRVGTGRQRCTAADGDLPAQRRRDGGQAVVEGGQAGPPRHDGVRAVAAVEDVFRAARAGHEQAAECVATARQVEQGVLGDVDAGRIQPHGFFGQVRPAQRAVGHRQAGARDRCLAAGRQGELFRGQQFDAAQRRAQHATLLDDCRSQRQLAAGRQRPLGRHVAGQHLDAPAAGVQRVARAGGGRHLGGGHRQVGRSLQRARAVHAALQLQCAGGLQCQLVHALGDEPAVEHQPAAALQQQAAAATLGHRRRTGIQLRRHRAACVGPLQHRRRQLRLRTGRQQQRRRVERQRERRRQRHAVVQANAFLRNERQVARAGIAHQRRAQAGLAHVGVVAAQAGRRHAGCAAGCVARHLQLAQCGQFQVRRAVGHAVQGDGQGAAGRLCRVAGSAARTTGKGDLPLQHDVAVAADVDLAAAARHGRGAGDDAAVGQLRHRQLIAAAIGQDAGTLLHQQRAGHRDAGVQRDAAAAVQRALALAVGGGLQQRGAGDVDQRPGAQPQQVRGEEVGRFGAAAGQSQADVAAGRVQAAVHFQRGGGRQLQLRAGPKFDVGAAAHRQPTFGPCRAQAAGGQRQVHGARRQQRRRAQLGQRCHGAAAVGELQCPRGRPGGHGGSQLEPGSHVQRVAAVQAEAAETALVEEAAAQVQVGACHTRSRRGVVQPHAAGGQRQAAAAGQRVARQCAAQGEMGLAAVGQRHAAASSQRDAAGSSARHPAIGADDGAARDINHAASGQREVSPRLQRHAATHGGSPAERAVPLFIDQRAGDVQPRTRRDGDVATQRAHQHAAAVGLDVGVQAHLAGTRQQLHAAGVGQCQRGAGGQRHVSVADHHELADAQRGGPVQA